MTKPQIWVAAFLVAFIVLFVIQKLTQREEATRDFSSQMNNPMTEESNTDLSAEQLIKNFGLLITLTLFKHAFYKYIYPYEI